MPRLRRETLQAAYKKIRIPKNADLLLYGIVFFCRDHSALFTATMRPWP